VRVSPDAVTQRECVEGKCEKGIAFLGCVFGAQHHGDGFPAAMALDLLRAGAGGGEHDGGEVAHIVEADPRKTRPPTCGLPIIQKWLGCSRSPWGAEEGRSVALGAVEARRRSSSAGMTKLGM
jgi:hypothetical protein